MTVVDERWYKELKDPDTFYTKVTAIKLLEHLTEFCAGLHTVDAVDIPQLMKELYKDSDGVPQYYLRNVMRRFTRKGLMGFPLSFHCTMTTTTRTPQD